MRSTRNTTREAQTHLIREVVRAASNMAKIHRGSHRFPAGTALGRIPGDRSEARCPAVQGASAEHFPSTCPLHDGAVIIGQGRVLAAGCVLPLTRQQLSSNLGTRHRAAVGISEVSDAVAVVVSEETGTISLAGGGTLERSLSGEELEERLVELLSPTKHPFLRKNEGWA